MTGLIGWWPLHETSGSAAKDLSGNGNHGSNNSPVQGVAGSGGLTAYSFNGSDDVNIGNNPALEGDLTISMWVNFDSFTSGGWSSSLARYDSDYNSWILIGAYDGNFAYTAAEGGNGYGTGQTTSLETSRWYHLVGTVRNGTVEGWLDGQVIETNTGIPETGVTHSSSMNWAISSYNNGRRMDGQVCNVRIYDRALSTQEIQTLYEWGSGDYTNRSYHDGSDSGAISRWEFNGDVTDSWGSNDGTDNTSAGYSSNAIRGQAKSFDGTDDYVSGFQPSINSQFTISQWVYTERFGDSTETYEGQIFNSQTGDTVVLQADETGDFIFRIYDSSESSNYMTRTKGKLMEWTHLVGTFDGEKLKLYENGSETDSVSTNFTFDNSSLGDAIFGTHPTAERHYKGSIDDVRIYSRALAPSEVIQLYQWGTRGRDMRKLTTNARGDQ